MNFFQKSKCCVCSKDLQALKLRKSYRCKKCHQDVCHYCSENRIKLYAKPNDYVKDFSLPQRVCDDCYKDYLYYQDIITQYELRWNMKSKLIQKWIGKSERKIKFDQQIDINDKEIIEKDVTTGRSDAHLFNYSLREFVSQCQDGYELNYIRDSITRVLELFVAHYPIIGYCQGMNYIATILLCVADEEGAFHIINQLFSKIIPPRFYSNSQGAALIGYQAELHFLKSMLKTYDVQCSEKLCQYLELQGPQFLLTLMLQVFNTSSLLVTWTQMFKTTSFIPIDQSLIFTLLTAAKQIDFSKPGSIEDIGKIIKYDDIIKIFAKENIYFTPFERQIQIEQYYSQTSRSWVNEDKLILFRLKKITNFDTEEILQIQQEFKKYCMDQKTVSINRQERQSFKQQAQLTDSSDDDDSEYIKTLQIQQIKLQKYGINKEAFLNLMELFHSNYTKYQILDRHKYELVFNLFDENKSELLDFREFLTCLSVLLRGTFEQKLKMFFSAHTGSILRDAEFQTLLSIIIPEELQRDQNYPTFLLRIYKPQYNYMDMLQVSQDEFLQDIDGKRQRSQTTVMLVDSFNKISHS